MKWFVLPTLVLSLLLAPLVGAQDEILAAETSRSDPIALGERGRVGGLVLGVDEVFRDARSVPDFEHLPLTREIGPDEQLVAVNVYVEIADTADYAGGFSLRGGRPQYHVVGRGTNQRIPEETGCSTIDTDDFTGAAAALLLYGRGASTVVPVCFIVPAEDVPTLVLSAAGDLSAANSSETGAPLWLALSENKTGTPVA